MKHRRCATAAIVVAIGLGVGLTDSAVAQQQQEPTWKWPEGRVFEVVNRARGPRPDAQALAQGRARSGRALV